MEPNIPHSPHPRIVILGEGFAGLSMAKTLRDNSFQIVLIDKDNYHTFQPLVDGARFSSHFLPKNF